MLIFFVCNIESYINERRWHNRMHAFDNGILREGIPTLRHWDFWELAIGCYAWCAFCYYLLFVFPRLPFIYTTDHLLFGRLGSKSVISVSHQGLCTKCSRPTCMFSRGNRCYWYWKDRFIKMFLPHWSLVRPVTSQLFSIPFGCDRGLGLFGLGFEIMHWTQLKWWDGNGLQIANFASCHPILF
jgi:hypothetical protein